MSRNENIKADSVEALSSQAMAAQIFSLLGRIE